MKKGAKIAIGAGVAAAAAGLVLLLTRKKAEAAPPEVYTCPYCGSTFGTYEEMAAHIESEHTGEEIPPEEEIPQVFTCPYCGSTFGTYEEMAAHIESEHTGEEIPPEEEIPEEEIPPEAAFRNLRIISYVTPVAIGGLCKVTVEFEYQGPAVSKELYAAIGNAEPSGFEEILHGSATVEAPQTDSWQPFEGYCDIPITSAIDPAQSPYDLYAKLNGEEPTLISETLLDVITILPTPLPKDYVGGFAARHLPFLSWADVVNGPGTYAHTSSIEQFQLAVEFSALPWNTKYSKENREKWLRGDRWVGLFRTLLIYNTESIIAGFKAAYLDVYVEGKSDTLGAMPSLVITPHNSGSNSEITEADYNRVSSDILSDIKPWADIVPGTWLTFTLNGEGLKRILAGGWTKLAIRAYPYDVPGLLPPCPEGLPNYYTAIHMISRDAKRPRLRVIY